MSRIIREDRLAKPVGNKHERMLRPHDHSKVAD